MCRVYIAMDLSDVGGTPDATEEFELVELSVAEISRRIATGEIWDGMSIAAWALAEPRIQAVAGDKG